MRLPASRWSKLLVAFLAFLALFSLGGFSLDIEPGTVLTTALLFAVLAAVAWQETPAGALLLLVVGLALVALEVASAAYYWYPEYGPQEGQYGAAAFFLAVPALAYLAWRDLRRRGAGAEVASPPARALSTRSSRSRGSASRSA